MIYHYANNYNIPPFMEYLDQFTHPKPFKTIIEVGARDALDTIFLTSRFGCKVHAFEPNPLSFDECVQNVDAYFGKDSIKLNNIALWSEEKDLDFFAVTNGNHGASSCFESNGAYPEKWELSPIKVKGSTLEKYMKEEGIEEVDLLAMDTQGAELNILKGAGEYLRRIKFIITEAAIQRSYYGAPLMGELDQFLRDNGFRLVQTYQDNHPSEWECDQLWERI